MKDWLSSKISKKPAPKIYKETLHQAAMTKLIDIDAAYQRSRSFKRLCDAIEELVTFDQAQAPGYVTPLGG